MPKTPPDSAPTVLVGLPGGPGYSDTPDCLVGQYDEVRKECGKRGGQAHHIVPDQMLRTGNRRTARRNSKSGSKADRRHPSFPTLGEGCTICVGGGATGAPATAGTMFEGTQGHDFLHQFEGNFGASQGPVSDAVEEAKSLLDKAAKSPKTAVSSECAKIAKECVEKQFEQALAASPEPTCQVRSPHSAEAIQNRTARLAAV